MTRRIADEGSGKGGPRKRAVRLHDKKDARRLIGQSVNFMLRGELSAEKGRAIVYAASVFIKSIETDELRWQQTSSEAQPSPAQFAERLRECMRMADAQIPPPPGGSDG